ncbi:MAG: nucleotidyltransferase domain-containing protein [candidate division WS1 bacterium]|jgi:predicted nucleotidyltransferase|nr:nucleotidyltransferase domain-containing protein [candidate division WS1 bacterium]
MGDNSVTEEQIREIARKIGEQPGVVQVWLFGSHATGTAGPDSDVDLLAVYEEEPDTLRRMRELDSLFFPRLFAMDIIVIGADEFSRTAEVPGGIAWVVKREGEVLYDRAS